MLSLSNFHSCQIVEWNQPSIKDIAYFIKFYDCYKFAEDLASGLLYMKAASSFWDDEGTLQSDPSDTRSCRCIGINSNRPIYCLYTVYRNDCADTKILIKNQVLKDFTHNYPQNVQMVLLDAQKFLEKFELHLSKNNLTAYAGIVKYNKSDIQDRYLLQIHREYLTFLFKHQKFSHQNEFRIQLNKPCKLEDVPLSDLNPQFQKIYLEDHVPFKRYVPHVEEIGNLRENGVAKLFTYSDLVAAKNSYILSLT